MVVIEVTRYRNRDRPRPIAERATVSRIRLLWLPLGGTDEHLDMMRLARGDVRRLGERRIVDRHGHGSGVESCLPRPLS